jgi:hypothetical protein
MGFHQSKNKNIKFKRVIGEVDKLPAVQAGRNSGKSAAGKSK